MKPKPVVLRRQADRDIQDAVDHYLAVAGVDTALVFVDAVEKSWAHIGRHPGAGSPKYGHELNLPGLRHWAVKGFPHLVFYVEFRQHVEVWRVLHEKRDIPAWMQDIEG